MDGRPTGTVTFLFTDIEGSTPLWDAYPDAMTVALARHDKIVRGAIDAAGGFVFSTGGDGFAAAFDRVGGATAAALAAQLGLAAESWAEGVELRVRMGIHSGEAHERDGDYFGPTVNRAARLMGAAHGGQVVVSDVTAGLLDQASAGVELVDLGAVRLKGLVEAIHVFGLTADGFPWLDRPLVSTQMTAGNLPRPQTEIVGDLVDLQRRVASLAGNRLVTLTGAGGVGKTRAAIEIGWLVIDEFPDGVWLVELGPIAEPDLVIAAVASVLGVQPQREMTLEASLVDWCQGRRVLLVLDNCEHVLGPVSALVSSVVGACATTTVLATSREPLGVAGEQVIRVPSLALSYGVELFGSRAAAAGADLADLDADREAIEAICTRLDGIPLAIELAAARSRSLGPRDILERLDDRFRLLRGSGRGMERHQTLRAAVRWSYDLLDDRQQLLFDRLSVFPGGFNLRAAEAVCSGDGLDELDVIDLLGELVDKSMVVAEREGDLVRYRILETLRQFGEDNVEWRVETEPLRASHMHHYRDLTLDLAPRWQSPEQREVEVTIALEWDNLRAAHAWALTCNRLDIAADLLDPIAGSTAYRLQHEVVGWIDRTLVLADRAGETTPRVALAGSLWAFQLAQPERAHELANTALQAGATGETRAMAVGLRLNSLAALGGDTTTPLTDAHALLAVTDEPVGRNALSRAILDTMSPTDPVSEELLEIVIASAQAIGSPGALAEAARHSGNFALLSAGKPGEAIDLYDTAIDLAKEVDAKLTIAWAIGGIGAACAYEERPEAPTRLAATIRYADQLHYPLIIETAVAFNSLYLATHGRLETAALALGYGEKRPSLFPMSAAFLAQTRAALADVPNVEGLVERGTRLERHEVMTLVLDALEASAADQSTST